jgi:hypothetical protein
MVYSLPASSPSIVPARVIPSPSWLGRTGSAVTLTVQESVLPLTVVTVTVAVPAPTACTLPFLSTIIIEVSDDV